MLHDSISKKCVNHNFMMRACMHACMQFKCVLHLWSYKYMTWWFVFLLKNIGQITSSSHYAPLPLLQHVFYASSLHLHVPFPVHDNIVCYNCMCEVMMDTQNVSTPQCHTWVWLQHLHGWFTCMSLNCKYTMVFKVILCNKHNTQTCIMQMIIWLCENACIYALGGQRVKTDSLATPIYMYDQLPVR